MKYRNCTYAITHTHTKKENWTNTTTHRLLVFFFIVSQLYIEHGPHTHACARAYREKKATKKENTKYFLCYRLGCILSYTHTQSRKKEEFTASMRAIETEERSERLTKKEAHTLRTVFVFALAVVVFTLPVDRIQHGHCPQ